MIYLIYFFIYFGILTPWMSEISHTMLVRCKNKFFLELEICNGCVVPLRTNVGSIQKIGL